MGFISSTFGRITDIQSRGIMVLKDEDTSPESQEANSSKGDMSREEEIALESAKEEHASGVAMANHDSFRTEGKTTRHYVAHTEYGLVFSLCGMRVTGTSIELNPDAIEGEIECDKCKVHLHK
jgi:hypothetical protein